MDIPKVSRYAFFAFLFLLPLSTVLLLREPFVGGEKWQYGVVALYGTDILLVLLLVLWAANRMWGRNKRQETRNKIGTIGIVLILFLLWSGLSITWAGDQVLALYFSVKLLLGAGVFFLARSIDDVDAKMAVKLLVAAAVFQAILGTGQFLAQGTFSSSLLGMSAHESWQAGTSVLKNESGRWLRAYGTFPHPNMLGGFLATVLVASISYLVSSITYGKNTKYIIRNTRYRLIIYHTSLILLLLGLILTFSRTAWLGAAIGIAAYCVFRIRYFVSDKKYIRSGSDIISRPWNYVTEFIAYFKVFFVLAAATIVFAGALHETILPRFDGATIASERSISEREISLDDARTLIMAHPFIGVGGGNFTAAIIDDEPDRPIWSIQPAHNVFALVLAELGIIGLLFFSFVLGSILFQLKQGENMIFAVALLTLLPSLFLDHWIFTSHFGILFFFLLAGFATRR